MTEPFPDGVLDAVATAIEDDYIGSMPYLTVVEGFFDRYKRNPTDYEADYIYDRIIKGDA